MLIPRNFFARPSVEVAPDLLGCVLEHETADGLVAVELTEVEAYAGRSDPASHAYRGKTARNAVMCGPARLCQALAINRSQDGADVVSAGSPLRMLSGAGHPARSAVLALGNGTLILPAAPRRIVTGPRVGVSSAAEIPWRFWYDGDPTVSIYRPHVPRRPKLVTP